MITVLPSFGISFETIYWCNLMRNSQKWHMWQDIHSIVINEGIRMCEVHYYLAIVIIANKRKLAKKNDVKVKNKRKEVIFEYHLPFKHFIPRLAILLPIYQQIKDVLEITSKKNENSRS